MTIENKINWSHSLQEYSCPFKEITIENPKSNLDIRINILNSESSNLMITMPGIGENGLKVLKGLSEAFGSDPFFNVLTFSNPKPYDPEVIVESVPKMLEKVGELVKKPEKIIIHSNSQGSVAVWSLLKNENILEKVPVCCLVLQAPLVGKENMSNILKSSKGRLNKLVTAFVKDPEKWNQEMGAIFDMKTDLGIIDILTLLIRYDHDGLVNYELTKKIFEKSFLNLQKADFVSNRKMLGHDTDDQIGMMKKELEFIKSCL